MADVKSKNLFELLGNDHDEDSDKEPEPPTKTVDKPLARTSKRNAPDVAPGGASERTGGDRGGRGGRRGGFTGNEEAYRDRNAGSSINRGKSTEDSGRGGRGRGRGGRGGYGDRHSRGQPHDHVKQADQSWGAPTGGAEWDDEKAGTKIAKDEAKDGFDSTVDAPADADGNRPPDGEGAAAQAEAEQEPEDNSKSYAEYLAELAEKKHKLGTGVLEARKPNEGAKQDKKWAKAKELTKEEEQESYIPAGEGKAKRERQRKEKATLNIDMRYVEPTRGGDRGRGGRGRGEYRGRGDGEFRGRGGRGGGRGRGDVEFRGGFRGNRGGRGDAVNVSDTSAFPSLGA